MSHICLTNGKRFDYDDRTTWGNLDPEVVAKSLSGLNRFLNHSCLPHNVAWHSVDVSYRVPPEHALAGLLHDWPEAVLGDMPAPLKRRAGFEAYRELEADILAYVLQAHGLATTLPDCVIRADHEAFVHEVAAIMPNQSVDMWGVTIPTESSTVIGHTNIEAQQRWLARYRELTNVV